MKALVIYDSVFGNTEKVAQAMAAALGGEAVRVGNVRPAHLQDVELLLVGSPTRGWRPTPEMSAWLKSLSAGSLKGVRTAAFDTRTAPEDVKPHWMSFIVKFGVAAKPIAELLQAAGGAQAADPEGFLVLDREGPMKPGEIERAAEWAKKLL